MSIINVELDLPSRCASANLRTGAPSPNDHEVLTQSLQVLFLVHAETKPQPYQKNYRCDSPHDSEHRQESAHLVRAERSQRLAQDFEQSHTLIPGNDAGKRLLELGARICDPRPNLTRVSRSSPTTTVYCSTT